MTEKGPWIDRQVSHQETEVMDHGIVAGSNTKWDGTPSFDAETDAQQNRMGLMVQLQAERCLMVQPMLHPM